MVMLFRSKGIFEGAKTANHLEELILHPGELATVPLEGLIFTIYYYYYYYYDYIL